LIYKYLITIPNYVASVFVIAFLRLFEIWHSLATSPYDGNEWGQTRLAYISPIIVRF